MITAVEIDELYYAEPIKTVTTPAAGLTAELIYAVYVLRSYFPSSSTFTQKSLSIVK